MHSNPVLVKEKEIIQSPRGLKVLVIDDNAVCLKVLGFLLRKCGHTVTTTTNAEEALEMLRKNSENFDIVITDIVRDDIDGFKLLEAIGLEMDIPVIMTSASSETRTIVEAIKHGASSYFVKPVKLKDIEDIYQHVNSKIKEDHNPISGNDTNEGVKDSITLPLKRHKNSIFQENEETDTQSSGESCPRKKNRMQWTHEMHQKFLNAFYQLQVDSHDKVAPKKILEIMNEPGITRTHVASHLQKYRNVLKKQNGNVTPSSITGQKSSNNFTNQTPCFMPRDQYEILLHQNVCAMGNFVPISSYSYSMPENLVSDPMLANNAISQFDINGLQYHHHCKRRKKDDELMHIPHDSSNFGAGQFYQDHVSRDLQPVISTYPYSRLPASLNKIGAPYCMFGDVSASLMTSTFPFESTGRVNSTPAQLDGGGFVSSNERGVSNGRGVSDFGEGANGSPINFYGVQIDGLAGNDQSRFSQFVTDDSERPNNAYENNCSFLDDDLSAMVQQFGDNSTPTL